MLDILLTILPIYILALLGYVSVRLGYVAPDVIRGLSQFTLKVCLPALIVFAIAIPRDEAGLNLALFAAYALGSLATLVLGFTAMRLLMRRPAVESWLLAFGMSNSNSGFIGFPVASVVFGAKGAVVFAMTMVVENMILFPLVTIAAGVASGSGAGVGALLRHSFGRILRNPVVLSVVPAVVIRLSGVHLGAPVERAVQGLAMAASPLALFVIGGTMAGLSAGGQWRRSGAVAFGKLVVHPLAVTAALLLIPGVPVDLIPVAILFASVSMLTIYPLVAGTYGLTEVATTATVITTLIGSGTVLVVLALLHGM